MKRINEIENNQSPSTILTIDYYPTITDLECSRDLLTATLSDGRIISIPTAWFSRLRKATESQLKNFEIAFDGEDITWPDLNIDISSKVFITGLNSSCC